MERPTDILVQMHFQCLFALLFLLLLERGTAKNYLTIIGEWVPDAVCNSDNPSDSSEIYGIQVNMIKKIYNRLEWTEGTNYYYQCMSWGNGWENVYNNSDALWFPATTTTYERLNSGRVWAQVTLPIQL